MLDYDKLVEQYAQYHRTPQCKYLDIYTYLSVIGNLKGKSVLDLGCGYGFYTRIFREQEADLVVGVDCSEEMLKLAKQIEQKNPLGIRYIQGDATELKQLGRGSFDLVTASYVLNDFSHAEQLEKFAQTSYLNLNSEGRFIALNENVQNHPNSYAICQKYGYTKQLIADWTEGALIKVKYDLDNDHSITFENHYLSRKTYEEAFKKAGFSKINWYGPKLSREGFKKYGAEFWQDFIKYQLMVIFEAVKSENFG